MLRSRRFALVAAAVILGLSACGDAGSSTSSPSSPAVIHIGSGNKAAAPTAEGGATADDRMIAPWGTFTYVYDGVYPDLGTSAGAWSLPAGGAVDEAQVAALAALLGVEGEVRALPADQGGGWMVGAADYSTANLTVMPDGMASWWYSPAPTAGYRGGGCAVAEETVVDPATGDTTGTDAGVDTPSAPPDSGGGTDAVPPCEEPQPPAGVPTKDEAEAKAKQLLADMGLDPASYEFTSYADEWGANVTAWLLLGGHRSPIQVNVGYGENGALTWASGSLATPLPAADYPLVDGATALARLNDQTGKWGWFGGGVAMGGVADAGVAKDAAMPYCDPNATDCAIEPGPMEPITITLNAMRLDLTMVWGEDGTVWLLPAYTFTSTDGGEYTIVAVDESLLDLPEPAPVDTVPVDTNPVDSVPPLDTVPVDPKPAPITTAPTVDEPGEPIAADVASAALVGLTVDEATKVAEGNGWTLRVSTLDGEGQMLTEDYSPTRVNVAVADGVVTGVDFIG